MAEAKDAKKKRKKRTWSWLPVIAAAIIGGAATVGGAFIAKGTGAIDIISGTASTPRVTITPKAAPTVTVTASPVSSQPGPFQAPDCLPSDGCRAWNLVVQMTPGSATGVTFSTGTVVLNGNGDLQYQKSDDGIAELSIEDAQAFSVAVTAGDASRSTCANVTVADPDAKPITNFHKGLLFCVYTGNQGTALVEETAPVGSSQDLDLREFYWPNQAAS
jgi:hypothetical protein